MIAALADAGAVLDEPRYLDAARSCAEFILRELRDGEGRLLRTYSEGRAHIGGYLEDHAFLLEALVVLFEATCAERWLTEARALAEQTIARFADPERGGFFSTPADGEELIARRKDLEDSPIPSGASSAALGLLRLAQLTGEESIRTPRARRAAPAARDRAPPPLLVRAPPAGAGAASLTGRGARVRRTSRPHRQPPAPRRRPPA